MLTRSPNILAEKSAKVRDVTAPLIVTLLAQMRCITDGDRVNKKIEESVITAPRCPSSLKAAEKKDCGNLGQDPRLWPPNSCLPAFLVKIPALLGKILAFLGKIPAFLVKIQTFLGKIPAFLGKIPTFLGKIPAFLGKIGKIPAFLGKIPTFLGKIPAFLGKIPAFLGKIPAFLGKILG
ncbi:hypothetical protein EMCRGX_G007700 [Ephydatia muelleri]